LISLGREEVVNIAEEQGLVMITCQFCAQEYRFNKRNIDQLFDPPAPLLH